MPSVTIGGVAATVATTTPLVNSKGAGSFYLNVASGTSTNIVVNSDFIGYIGITVGALTGAAATSTSFATLPWGFYADPQVTPALTVPHNGVAIVVGGSISPNSSATFNIGTEDYSIISGTSWQTLSGHISVAGSETPSISGFNFAGMTMAAAAWGLSTSSGPVISSISSGSPTTTSATITWTTNEAASSEVVYGTTSAYGSATSSASLITSHSIGVIGLTASSTYHYAVVSTDSLGNTATSSDQTFTTASSPDTTSPSTPTNLTAIATSSSQIDLSWTASNDNGGGDAVTGYQVFRGGSQIATSTQTTYADTGLSASTTYTYVVKAFDAAGNVSASSTSATATTTAAGVTFTPTANPAIQYDAYAVSTTTFSNVNIGTASSNREVVVGVSSENSNSCVVAALTIGGVYATEATSSDGGHQNTASIWYATIPSGTTANITLGCGNLPSDFGLVGILAGTITGASPAAPTATGVHPSDFTANPQPIPTSGTITVPTNGAAVIIGEGPSGCASPVWTNTTSSSGDYTVSTTTEDTMAWVMAHSYAAGSESYTYEDPGGEFGSCASQGFSGAVAAWAP